MTDRHCLQNAALIGPPCRRAYIATSCATGMRIGENRGSWPETSWSISMALSSLVSRSSFLLMGGFRWRAAAFPFKMADAVPLRNFRRNIPPVIRMSLTFTASMSLRCTLSISPAVRNRTSLRAVWDTCVVILAAASSFTQHGGPTSRMR